MISVDFLNFHSRSNLAIDLFIHQKLDSSIIVMLFGASFRLMSLSVHVFRCAELYRPHMHLLELRGWSWDTIGAPNRSQLWIGTVWPTADTTTSWAGGLSSLPLMNHQTIMNHYEPVLIVNLRSAWLIINCIYHHWPSLSIISSHWPSSILINRHQSFVTISDHQPPTLSSVISLHKSSSSSTSSASTVLLYCH